MRRHQLLEEQQDLIEAYLPGRPTTTPSRRFQELAINSLAALELAVIERNLRLRFSGRAYLRAGF